MKKTFIIIFLLIGNAISQNFQIGIGGGSTFVTGQKYYTNNMESIAFQDYFGSPYTVTNTSGLHFGSEYNFDIKFRLFLKNLPFNLVSEMNFNSFVGSGSIRIVPSPASSFLPPLQKAESNCKVINLSLGAEYVLTKTRIVPYLSGNFLISYFDDIEIKSVGDEFSSYRFRVSDGGLRYGFEIGIGVDYGLIKYLSIGISSKYAMNNLIGRKSSEKRLDTIKTNFNLMYKFGNGP